MVFKSLKKDLNLFKLEGFKELVEFKEEKNIILEDTIITKTELKKMDDKSYSSLLSGCKSQEFIENINKYFYMKTKSEECKINISNKSTRSESQAQGDKPRLHLLKK